MSQPIEFPIEVFKGATFDVDIPVLDTANANAPAPLDGWTARAQGRITKGPNAGALLFDSTTENGAITLSEGNCRLTIPADVSEAWALDVKAGEYDVELIAPGSPRRVVRLVRASEMTIHREVTRDGA